MEIRFESSDSTLRSLYRWLRDERELRGSASVRIVGEPDTGAMGGALDAVLAVLSTGAAVGQLAIAVAAWREAKRPRSNVTVVVYGGEAADAEPLLRALGEGQNAAGKAGLPNSTDSSKATSSPAEPRPVDNTGPPNTPGRNGEQA